MSESLNAAGERMAITFTARDSAGAFVRQTYRVRPDTYAIDLEVELRGLSSSQIPEYSLATRSWPLLTESDLSQDMRSLRATSLVGTNLHREHAGGLIKAPKIFDGNAAWAGVQTRYFFVCVAASEAAARGVVSHAERRPMTSAEQEQLGNVSGGQMEIASNALVVSVPSELKPVQRFVLYTGPSEVSSLRRLKLGLERSVDLGWSWVQPFSKAMLELLRWLYGLVRNYGVAIILLATLIRVLLHPLNMVSMKSMRAMQRLQPEIERLREKYKNDPQAMNTAIMGLYKEYKVNPAGGCFPMLLQIPVFFALYQVLFNAIELRQAPFFGWINDLSAPDLLAQVGPVSIRLLPVLMLGSGFLSQKLTPSDPRQLPTMYMMNVVMLVFFYNLPSGLVLYWTLMNLLTALQQWLLIRQDGGKAVAPAPTAVPARAMAGGRGRSPDADTGPGRDFRPRERIGREKMPHSRPGSRAETPSRTLASKGGTAVSFTHTPESGAATPCSRPPGPPTTHCPGERHESRRSLATTLTRTAAAHATARKAPARRTFEDGYGERRFGLRWQDPR